MSMSDPLIVMNQDSEATGQILIPHGSTVTKDEYDPKKNLHTTMFNFWDELNIEMQHCLYEINYNNYEVTSFIKDRNFEWMELVTEKLEGYDEMKESV